MDYILTTPYLVLPWNDFINIPGSGALYADGDTNFELPSAVGCSSTYMNKKTWGLFTNYYLCAEQSTDEFGLALWVKFSSTLGTEIITIGDINSDENIYKISSSTEGTLSFTYSSTGSKTTPSDTLTDVPHNSWTLLTFYWKSADKAIRVYLPGKAEIIKTSLDSDIPLIAPYSYGSIRFGSSLEAYFYRLIGFKTASISGAVITLSIGSQTYTSGTCPAGCADTYCDGGTTCLSSYSYCSSCDSTGCLKCGSTVRDSSTYCTTCNGSICCPDNCSKCSSAEVCTICDKGYFLYDKDSSTTCASCTDSCSSCEQSPSCFECVDSIAKDGSTCRVDSVGYQLSFSYPNIVLDFAHTLSRSISINSLSALDNDDSPIDTSAWALSGCSAGSISCKVLTNNLSESMFPITLDFLLNEGEGI